MFHIHNVARLSPYYHTRAVHKLLRQRKLKGTWERYKLDFRWLDTTTLFLSTCKIRLIAEGIQKHHPKVCGALRRRKRYVSKLMWVWQHHSFSMYTLLIEYTSNDTERTYHIHMFCKFHMCRCYCDAVSQCNNPHSLASDIL